MTRVGICAAWCPTRLHRCTRAGGHEGDHHGSVSTYGCTWPRGLAVARVPRRPVTNPELAALVDDDDDDDDDDDEE